MKIREIKWIEKEGTYYGFINHIQLFSIFYDGMTPQSEIKDNKNYIIAHTLPGIKVRINVESIEKGKECAETLITMFIRRMTEKEGKQ